MDEISASDCAWCCAFGNAAHAMGIARAQQRHSEEGVVASLSMIISGIIMVLFAPPVIALIKMLS